MAVYRVTRTDGSETELQAQRMRREVDRTVFEARSGGLWVPSAELPDDEVRRIDRRVTEMSGYFRWVEEDLR